MRVKFDHFLAGAEIAGRFRLDICSFSSMVGKVKIEQTNKVKKGPSNGHFCGYLVRVFSAGI
jgi:hypothetical protein